MAALLVAIAGCGSSSSSTTTAATNGTTPATNGTTPATNGTTPATNGTTPATNGTTPTVSHAKTKFALHAGLAFGAIYQWIYKPAKAGELKHPLQHKLTALKAAAAGAFAYHELRLALAAAQADPTLSHLVAPITALQNKIKGVPSQVSSSGGTSSSVADELNSSISSIKGQAASAGQTITNQVPATPSG
jgi:hypothetical protein